MRDSKTEEKAVEKFLNPQESLEKFFIHVFYCKI